MKTSKKLAGLLLALVMVLTMAIPAFAAGEKYTVTINNSVEGHTYEAYQIFAGDLAEKDGKTVLSNITWGNGVDGAALLAELKTQAAFAACTTAADVAEVLHNIANDSEMAQSFAQIAGKHLAAVAGTSTFTDGKYTISNLDAGYYLVKDQDGSVTGDDSYTRFILEVVNDVTATPKSSKPAVEKKVEDINDSTGDASDWQDSADYDIGDSVPFRLIGTLPSTYVDYKTYKYIFHDTLSDGLTYNNDAKVYVENDGEERIDVTDQFTITETDGTLTVSIADLKTIVSVNSMSKITVEYTATLNINAVIGSAGNPNTVNLEYSNNPNMGGEGETGTTPDDTVIVFTYKTVINKVDGEGNPLTGAEFTLEKFVKGDDGVDEYNTVKGTWTPIDVVKNAEGTEFTFKGLDDGIYRLTESVTPAGYNTIESIVFTVNAEHDILADNPALTSLTGEAVTGLITFTPVLAEGALTTDVVNNAGSILPSTGGIGTTLFYVFGALLVIGAGVLLVVKKRMSVTK